ncbi:AAA family ATPase [Polyangium fumosum]|uniref:ATPase AAA-type core domain-containing protein n=1 Tax=Polyangium fumosum TaxID=889272 RepID=A0A4U1J5C6_9BACT|nr:ATP-binding protein [Polyangium fumosum]TKD01678.1 hypothetical protein E8A74_30500 [Polyangium fumosum]
MLKSLGVRGFKSLADVGPIELAPLTVVFGPNTAGKSNLIDALQVLSRLATANTVAEALGPPVRGLPLESFTFPQGGLPALLARTADDPPTFRLRADLRDEEGILGYEVEIGIAPQSGALSVRDERLSQKGRSGTLVRDPDISLDPSSRMVVVRRKRKSRESWWEEEAGQNHTQLSNRRYSGNEYPALSRARALLSSMRAYYLDPRVAMRAARAPQEVDDIGPLGEDLAPFLYRLKAENPKVFASVKRSLCTVIPSVDDLSVDLDPRRGVLDVEIKQNGTAYSSRVISEGTLRVLALACVATNPWTGSVVAFEEPENGVHPRRVELIAQLLGSLALGSKERRQVIVTTHSPLFCAAALRIAWQRPRDVRLIQVTRDEGRSRFEPFNPLGPLFQDPEIRDALTAKDEDVWIEGLLVRGLFDG